MAPLRRYLRITKYSVLECRIYLDNPALAYSWLLNPRDPVLPRIIEAVRPFVLPKLREERERSRKKSAKKRGIKDTVTEDDFEVSLFLTETSTRHSLLYKHKHFHDTTQTKLTSNSTRLVGASRDAPIDVEGGVDGPHMAAGDDEDAAAPQVHILREESDDDDVVALRDIPTVDEGIATIGEGETATAALRDDMRPAAKRRRGRGVMPQRPSDDGDSAREPAPALLGSDEEDDDGDGLFVDQNEEEEEDDVAPPAAKRRRGDASEHEGPRDDKKKLAMDISYEGFAIYGRVLCLVVKRREDIGGGKGKGIAGTTGRAGASSSTTPGWDGRGGRGGGEGGRAGMMENWITSTQLPEAAADGLLDAS